VPDGTDDAEWKFLEHCSSVVSPCNTHSGVSVVYPEDPGLCRLLSADDSFHYELEKKRFGAFPVFQSRLDPYILDVHWYGSAGENVQNSVTQRILGSVYSTQLIFSLWGYGSRLRPQATTIPKAASNICIL
jgi:hypothetical protein